MAVKITSTKDYKTRGVKALVYSPAGYGKTHLIKTAPNPVIISTESGLLTLADEDIPVLEVKTIAEIGEAYKYITQSAEGKKFETICLDCITDIAEALLAEYKLAEKDPRAAYGKLNDSMASLIRTFRDIRGRHVYFTAKQLRQVDDDSGRVTCVPLMPGKTLLNGISYFFDEVFALKVGKLKNGEEYRYLQTSPDGVYDAKDRSGRLLPKDRPDLTYVFDTIVNTDRREIPNPEESEEETSETSEEASSSMSFTDAIAGDDKSTEGDDLTPEDVTKALEETA